MSEIRINRAPKGWLDGPAPSLVNNLVKHSEEVLGSNAGSAFAAVITQNINELDDPDV